MELKKEKKGEIGLFWFYSPSMCLSIGNRFGWFSGKSINGVLISLVLGVERDTPIIS